MTIAASETISKGMVNFASKVPKESIIEVNATVVVPEKPVDSCTQKVELSINEFWVINRSAPILPFQIEDASRLVLDQASEGLGGGDKVAVEENKDEESK